jgi:ligand-binding sensor domain-containing protein
MPSDKVYSVCILPDGTQWFGTDSGVARHIGFNTLKNWTVFNKSKGLIDNYVQAIACDKKSRLWFGTKAGVSVYDDSTWISHSEHDGLCSNNVLCIAVDKDGVVWMGTDKGVTSFKDGIFINYK